MVKQGIKSKSAEPNYISSIAIPKFFELEFNRFRRNAKKAKTAWRDIVIMWARKFNTLNLTKEFIEKNFPKSKREKEPTLPKSISIKSSEKQDWDDFSRRCEELNLSMSQVLRPQMIAYNKLQLKKDIKEISEKEMPKVQK